MADFFGDDRDNTFNGDATDNIAQGNGGDDRLNGHDGFDKLSGGIGADILDGGADGDRLYSFVFAWDPDDEDQTRPILDNGTERDTLLGGDGDDTIYAGYGDTIDGGSGLDYAELSFRGADTGIDADFSVLTDGGTLTIGGATIAGLEAIVWVDGSEFDDTFTFSSDSRANNGSQISVYGFGGNDRIIQGYTGGEAYGGDGNDIIDARAAQYGENLYGEDGDDTIYACNGYAFSVTLYGGNGQDMLIGGENDDRLDGGSGQDTLIGDANTDTLAGGDDNDILDGGIDNDVLNGGAGIDQLYGGAGRDFLDGGIGADILYGDSDYSVSDEEGDDLHDDYIKGGEGDDTIYGEAGNDVLYADGHQDYVFRFDSGGERDVLSGGDGDDIVSVGFNDDAYGGDGTDTLILSFMASAQGVTLRTADLLDTGFLGGGAISGFEVLDSVRGSERADNIVASVTVYGGGGDDRLVGAAGDVELYGDAGDDLLISAHGQNNLAGGDGVDTVSYAQFDAGITVSLGGKDHSYGYGEDDDYLTDIENVIGTRAADNIDGNYKDNMLTGGLGDDVFNGYQGGDVIKGGGGADILNGQEGDDTLDGGKGADTMSGDVGSDTYFVDDAGDVVHEYPGDDLSTDTVYASVDFALPGYVEDLFLTGRAHAGTGNSLGNRIIGSGGANTLSGLGGTDIIAGGAGRDVIDGGNGDDTLTGGADRDTLTGGRGADTFRFTPGDAGGTARTADTITDFSHADGDTINLSSIDAVVGTHAIEAFRFIGDRAFSGTAGQLRYEVSHGDTLVMGDTDGDGAADLVIRLTGNVALTASDFVHVRGNALHSGLDAASIDTHAAIGGGAHASVQVHELLV